MIVQIINWEKYNPRKDIKMSSWFRLENNFCLKTFRLSSDEKCVFIMLLGAASEKNNAKVDFDVELAATILQISVEVVKAAVDKLVKHNFINVISSDVRPRNAHVTPTNVYDTYETRRDETNETITSSPCSDREVADSETKLTPAGLLEIWNTNRGSLPEAKRMAGKRERSARARLKENSDPEFWKSIVKMAASNSFFTGDNDRKWKADIDWFLTEKTLNSALEGKYERQSSLSANKGGNSLAERIERQKQVEEKLAKLDAASGLEAGRSISHLSAAEIGARFREVLKGKGV